MEKRTLIAFGLSFLIIAFYPHFMRMMTPQTTATSSIHSVVGKNENTLMPSESTQLTHEAPPLDPYEERLEEIQTPQYDIGFSNKYASISRLSLAEIEDPQTKSPLLFFDAMTGATGAGAVELSVNGSWQTPTSFETQISADRIKSIATDTGYVFEKRFSFYNSIYGNELEISYKNTSSENQNIRINIYTGSGMVKRSVIDTQYFEANWIDSDVVEHIKPLKLGKTKLSQRPYMATSIKNRHFSSILKPLGETKYMSEAKGIGGKDTRDFTALLMSPVLQIGPGETWEDRFLLYVGPNTMEALKPFELGSVIHFGKLDSICKFLVGGMQLIQGIFKNYGVSIIILTIGLNLLLYPLTRASFISMKRVSLVQPYMMTLREKYKKDPQRLSREMTALYKKYKVNPMGGCLPMILQMPVFISLYVSLSKSAELVGSNFLWIKDLSSPDIIPLPFTIPFIGNTFHLLPILTTVIMFLQQKVSQKSMPQSDPNVQQQQKMMMYIMPVFLGFIFYQMPSALVLYVLTNALAMAAIQLSLRTASIELPRT